MRHSALETFLKRKHDAWDTFEELFDAVEEAGFSLIDLFVVSTTSMPYLFDEWFADEPLVALAGVRGLDVAQRVAACVPALAGLDVAELVRAADYIRRLRADAPIATVVTDMRAGGWDLDPVWEHLARYRRVADILPFLEDLPESARSVLRLRSDALKVIQAHEADLADHVVEGVLRLWGAPGPLYEAVIGVHTAAGASLWFPARMGVRRFPKLRPHDRLRPLRSAGFDPGFAVLFLHEDLGLGLLEIAAAMSGAGYGEAEVVRGLRSNAVGPAQAIQLLIEHGADAPAIVAALVANGLSAAEVREQLFALGAKDVHGLLAPHYSAEVLALVAPVPLVG